MLMTNQNEKNDTYSIDKKIAINLQRKFKDYIDILYTDNTELSDGLGISRPMISKFMNAKNEDIELLSITPDKIINLWKTLTSEEKIDSNHPNKKRYRRNPNDPPEKDIEKEAIDARKELLENGPDELLVAAGYLPQDNKWIGVSPERYSMIRQIVLLLDNKKSLKFDTYIKMIQQVIQSSMLLQKVDSKENSEDENDIFCPKNLLDIKESKKFTIKYQDKIIFYETMLNKKLTIIEKKWLILTMLSNKITQENCLPFKLKFFKCEFVSLSLKFQDEYINLEIKNIKKQLDSISEKIEQNLKTPGSNKNESLAPITRTSITCEYIDKKIKSIEENRDYQNLIHFS